MQILQVTGSTSLVRLEKVVLPGCAEVWVKLEWENPTYLSTDVYLGT